MQSMELVAVLNGFLQFIIRHSPLIDVLQCSLMIIFYATKIDLMHLKYLYS